MADRPCCGAPPWVVCCRWLLALVVAVLLLVVLPLAASIALAAVLLAVGGAARSAAARPAAHPRGRQPARGGPDARIGRRAAREPGLRADRPPRRATASHTRAAAGPTARGRALQGRRSATQHAPAGERRRRRGRRERPAACAAGSRAARPARRCSRDRPGGDDRRLRERGRFDVPPRIAAELPETFVEAMAYPVFDLPMYAPLRDLSAELLIPNVNLIENNSITLLETNQKFIEAYMVGLNHEFARELLWREYPTDQRGSYFRQFWDVSSFLAGAAADDADAARAAARHPAAPPLAAGVEARRPRCSRAARRQRGGGRARHPRRAAEAVPERRHLRAGGGVGSGCRTATSTARRSARWSS